MKHLHVWRRGDQMILLSLGPIVLLLAYLGSYSPRLMQVSEINNQASQPLRVAVKKQPDSPLLISLSQVNSTNPQSPEVRFLMVNKSSQAIRAYAVQYTAKSAHMNSGGVDLNNIVTSEHILQPGQSRSDGISSFASHSEPIELITLSIDFVEYMDGTIWGPDHHQSAEVLAGMRVGARAAINFYSKSLQVLGARNLIKVSDTELDNIEPPSGHSERWIEGFRSGKGSIRERLRQVLESGSKSEIESELRKPFDLSDWR